MGEGLLKDGVAAVYDDEFGAVGEGGAGVAVELGGLGEGAEGVDLGDGGGGFFELGEVGDDLLAEVEEEFVFELFGAFFGAEDFVFHFFERGGDVALGVGHGLFAGVVFGDFFEVGFGDFDEVAEDVVEFDFEGVDAGAFALVFLEAGDPVFSGTGGGAEVVEGG